MLVKAIRKVESLAMMFFWGRISPYRAWRNGLGKGLVMSGRPEMKEAKQKQHPSPYALHSGQYSKIHTY